MNKKFMSPMVYQRTSKSWGEGAYKRNLLTGLIGTHNYLRGTIVMNHANKLCKKVKVTTCTFMKLKGDVKKLRATMNIFCYVKLLPIYVDVS